jgi:hypothetical protein
MSDRILPRPDRDHSHRLTGGDETAVRPGVLPYPWYLGGGAGLSRCVGRVDRDRTSGQDLAQFDRTYGHGLTGGDEAVVMPRAMP